MRNCDACGGTIRYVNNHIGKCDYCGRLFKIDNDKLTEANLDAIYQEALCLLNKNKEESITDAIHIFEALGAYKDSFNKAYDAKCKLSKAKADEAERKLEEKRRNEIAEIERQKREYAERQKKKIFTLIAFMGLAIGVVIVVIVSFNNSRKKAQYDKALACYERHDYDAALEAFDSISGYKDSSDIVKTIQELILEREAAYNKGVNYYNEGLYQEAMATFSAISDYLDSEDYIEKSAKMIFAKAQELYNSEEYEKAQKLFIELGDYQDSNSYLSKIGTALYSQAENLYSAGEYVMCGDILQMIDESREWNQYQSAIKLLSAAKDVYISAVSLEAKNICRSQGESEMKSYINGKICSLLTDENASTLKRECIIKRVSMENMDPYAEGTYGLGHETSETDTLGNTYAFALRGYMSVRDGGAYEIYNIGKQYKYLCATVAVAKRDHIREDYRGHIRIYGDDRLLWSNDDIMGTTKPYDIQVDIEGVEDLKIEMYGAGNMGNYGIHILLCNPTLLE